MSAARLDRALERAQRFVARCGDELARSRMEALRAPGPVALLPEALAALQTPEGGFARARLGSAAGPSLAGTLEALAVLDDLRLLDRPEVERAARYLAEVQHADGAWAIAPSDPEPTRLVLTGLLGGYLAKTGVVPIRVVDGAGAFLASLWSPERVRSGDYGALVAFAHFFSNAPHELSDAVLQWCGRELERSFRSDRRDALRTVRVFTLCDAQALPGSRLDAGEVVPALLVEQGEPGCWLPSQRCTALQVSATLDATLALVRFGHGSG